MRTFLKKDIIFNILTLFIGLGIIIFISDFLKLDVVLDEDTYQIFFDINKLSDLYINADHGALISWVTMKVVGSVFPLITGTHPNCNWLGSSFIGFTIASYIFLVSCFASVCLKQKSFSPFLYIIAFAVLIDMFLHHICLVELYCRHFRNVFVMLFYLLFWLHFSKVFIEQKINSKNLVLISIISFCAGLSSEPVNLSAFFSITIVLFIQMVIIYFKENKNIKDAIESVKKTDKSIFIPLICFFAGFILLYTNPTFWIIADERSVSSNVSNFSALISLFPEFMQSWSLHLFKVDGQNILTICLVVFSAVCLLLGRKDIKAIRTVLLSWSLVLGASLFYFSLIAGGKTFHDGFSFWTISRDLKSVIFCVFLCSVFLLAGYILEVLVNKCSNKKILPLIALISFSMLFCSYKKNRSLYKWLKKEGQEKRETMYVTEKLYVFYNLKNQTAVLPESVLTNTYFRLNCVYNEEYGNKDQYANTYYKKIYKKANAQQMQIMPDEQALQHFYELDGTFEEGEIKQADFTKLLDEDFVLNNKT